MGDEDDDNVSTEEWPPAANKKVEEGQDPEELQEQLERLEVVKASEKLREFKDTRNLYDIFESPAVAKLPTGKPKGRTELRGQNVPPMFLGEFASGNMRARRVCDDSDLGRLGGFDSNRLEQANRGRLRDSGNRGRGQRGMRHAQSLSSLVGWDQSSGTRENTEERYGFERNKLRVRGLSESTTDDALTNFIEAMSGEEVKEVQKLRNGNAIVTMVNDITSKSIFIVIIVISLKKLIISPRYPPGVFP